MLKRITTAGVTLASLGAFALGGSVIASASTHHVIPNHHAIAAKPPAPQLTLPAGLTFSPVTRTRPIPEPARPESETPSASDGPGGSNVQSGNQAGGPDTSSAKSETSTETPGAESDGPGGPNVQSDGNTQQ